MNKWNLENTLYPLYFHPDCLWNLLSVFSLVTNHPFGHLIGVFHCRSTFHDPQKLNMGAGESTPIRALGKVASCSVALNLNDGEEVLPGQTLNGYVQVDVMNLVDKNGNIVHSYSDTAIVNELQISSIHAELRSDVITKVLYSNLISKKSEMALESVCLFKERKVLISSKSRSTKGTSSEETEAENVRIQQLLSVEQARYANRLYVNM